MKKTVKIGIVVADVDEYKPFYEQIKPYSPEEYSVLGRTAHRFTMEGEKLSAEVHSVLCGIGKVNAAAAAMHLADSGCELLLNFGLSGGVSGVKRGDICLCTRFLEHDFDLTGIGYQPCEKPLQKYIYDANQRLTDVYAELLPNAKKGIAVSGDHFVCDPARRDFLKNTFQATSCDMETAAVAYVADAMGIPFAAVRKISDDAGDDAGGSYREMNTSGETALAELVLDGVKALLNSGGLSEL